jgi:glycosyltransferase involved in cell wall biosynthesis
MKVAMLINGYFPRIGGAERILTALTPKLIDHNIEPVVVTRKFPGLSAFEVVNGVSVYRMPIPEPKALASLSFTYSAMSQLADLKPDLLHAHDLLSTMTTAFLAKKRWHLPVVATIHRSGPLGDIDQLKGKVAGGLRWRLSREAVDRFIVISREIDLELAGEGVKPEKRVLISNGIDVEDYQPASQSRKRELRRRFDLPDVPVGVFVGRLAPEKRLDRLIALWPEVRNSVPGAILLILGDGPERKRLDLHAGEGVRLAGATDDVAPYLQASDLFVLPSAAEGLSVAALEAQACGLPVLLTAVGGARDIVTHGENGWLIAPDDDAALAEALKVLLSDEALRTRLAQQGRQSVEHNFSLTSVASRLASLYQSLLVPESRAISPQQEGHSLDDITEGGR